MCIKFLSFLKYLIKFSNKMNKLKEIRKVSILFLQRSKENLLKISQKETKMKGTSN